MTDQKLSYADLSHVFDPELSELRDIYIVGTDADTWRALLTELASSEWESRLFEGQSTVAGDVTVEKIFSVNASPDEETYSLRVTVADAWLWCHFYDFEEIEFSFAAEAIDSAAKFDELMRFLKFLATTAQRDTKLTLEAPDGATAPPIILVRPDETSPQFFGV